MLGIGTTEILVILLIALIILGPKRFPKLIRAIAKATHRVKRTLNSLSRDINTEVRDIRAEIQEDDSEDDGRV